MASGGVSSPQCSTATAPISVISDAASLMYGRFRTEKYAYAKCEIIITWKYVYREKEREGTSESIELSGSDVVEEGLGVRALHLRTVVCSCTLHREGATKKKKKNEDEGVHV